MARSILRSNGGNPEGEQLRILYPKIFDAFSSFLEQDPISEKKFRKQFALMCEKIRTRSHERYAVLERPASSATKGRLLRDELTLRNIIRRNVYILLQDFVGSMWLEAIEDLVKRASPGKRATSPRAKMFTNLLHYILREDAEADLVVLSSDAISDMANQLAYAQRHAVPYQFVIGFLTEVGFDEAARKERAGEWEPWHPESVGARKITEAAAKETRNPLRKESNGGAKKTKSEPAPRGVLKSSSVTGKGKSTR